MRSAHAFVGDARHIFMRINNWQKNRGIDFAQLDRDKTFIFQPLPKKPSRAAKTK
jgi:hypothetical protein